MRTTKTKSFLFIALMALAAMLALSACGSNNDEGSSSPSASAPASSSASEPTSSAPAAGGQTIEVTVTATNFAFDPQEIKAKVGDTLKITLKNESGNHGVESKDLGFNLKNGETAEVVLDKAGTFEYNCSIMCGTGHDSMTGEIIVE